MSSDVEIERALAAITATINDQGMESFDAGRVKKIANESLGERRFTVDDGGGVHDESGARIAAIRRTSSGEWIAERQNEAAERSDSEIPTSPPEGGVRKFFNKLKDPT